MLPLPYALMQIQLHHLILSCLETYESSLTGLLREQTRANPTDTVIVISGFGTPNAKYTEIDRGETVTFHHGWDKVMFEGPVYEISARSIPDPDKELEVAMKLTSTKDFAQSLNRTPHSPKRNRMQMRRR